MDVTFKVKVKNEEKEEKNKVNERVRVRTIMYNKYNNDINLFIGALISHVYNITHTIKMLIPIYIYIYNIN